MARYRETDPHAPGRSPASRFLIALAAGVLGAGLALTIGAAG